LRPSLLSTYANNYFKHGFTPAFFSKMSFSWQSHGEASVIVLGPITTDRCLRVIPTTPAYTHITSFLRTTRTSNAFKQ
jgi:hypothetical protein